MIMNLSNGFYILDSVPRASMLFPKIIQVFPFAKEHDLRLDLTISILIPFKVIAKFEAYLQSTLNNVNKIDV